MPLAKLRRVKGDDMNIELNGARLDLIPLYEHKISYCLWRDWLTDPKVNRYMMSGLERPSRLDLIEYGEEGICLGIFLHPIYKSKNDGWIGNIRLHQINKEQRTAELGIMIGDKERWGQGYATEACTLLLSHAFGKMNLHRVGIGVVCKNQGGLALWTKLGFREEGRLREAFWVDGKACDVIRMGLLQREWFNEDSRRSSSAIG